MSKIEKLWNVIKLTAQVLHNIEVTRSEHFSRILMRFCNARHVGESKIISSVYANKFTDIRPMLQLNWL